jgi:hypothetical protein
MTAAPLSNLLDLEDGNLEPQPVLELLSARRKLSGRNYARGPEAEYAAMAKSNTGALSIFISRRDARSLRL